MSKPSFETALKRLEAIVKELEQGELPLDKALKRYEEGVKLAKICQERLDQAELKLKRLRVDEGGKVVMEEWDPEEE